MNILKFLLFTLLLFCNLRASPDSNSMKEYWSNRLPPVKRESVKWLTRLQKELHSESHGCRLVATLSPSGELMISVENTLTKRPKNEPQAEYLLNGQGILIDDMIFSDRWHKTSPIGITLMFYTTDGHVYGYSAELGYEYGWNGRIISSQSTTSGGYLTLLRRGDVLRRTICIKDMLSSFFKAIPQCSGQTGHFIVVSRVPLLGWSDGGLKEVECLYQAVEIPFTPNNQ